MYPKKQKLSEGSMPDLNQETVSPGGSSSTMSTQPEEASTSQMAAAREVKAKEEEEKKEEDNADSKGPHSHQFTVKFSNEDVKYPIDCDQPRTVLDAIKLELPKQFQRMTNKENSELKIIIQLRKKGKESIVATHFPCSCIENGESVVIYYKTEEVEETKSQHDELLPRDKYSVFYIATKAGINARKEKLFKSTTVKEFDYLCVYAKRGTSVKEALERDGRFNDLEDFKLSEVENSNKHTLCTQKVDNLDQKKFKICRDRKPANYANEQTSSEQQEQPSTSKQPQQKFDTKSVLDAAQKSVISVKRAMEASGSKANTEEIYKLLCEQFQDLKTLMESRFPGDSYQKALELKKEDFGKIQQSFSEVHRVEKLLELGKSVCKVIVKGVTKGTGFVLLDRLILTSAHLFKGCVEENKLQEGTEVYALFNYDEPEPNTKYHKFTAEKTFIDFDLDLDYAVLELNPKGQKHNQPAETQEAKLPEGLLSKFGPPPKDGEACLLGHPAGEVKKIDPTCIIEKKDREQAVNQNLEEYRDYIFTLCSINQGIKKDPYADIFVTYNSFMYHGASGSPVFDAHGQVFGLHSGGFFFNFIKPNESVIEYAYPLLTIFENFVRKLDMPAQTEMLEKIENTAKENSYLKQIIDKLNAEKLMETNLPTRSEAPQ